MAEPLTPEEIDALLNSLKESTSGHAESTPAAPAPALPSEYTPEVSAPAMPFGELSRDAASKLGVVAESFRASLEKALKPILQIPFSVRVGSLGLSQPVRNPLSQLRFEGFVGALDFDNNLATAMADRLMGGQARPASRPAGELERAILTPVFSVFAEALTYGLRHYGQSPKPFSDEDITVDSGVQISLDFDLSGLVGGIRIVLPQLFVGAEEAVEEVSTDWIIDLGSARMTAQSILDLKVGDIIKLDRHADANLVLVAGDEEFLGRPVLEGDRLLFSVAGKVER